MTETPTKVIVDCSTGESTIVPLTAEEIAQREADALAWQEAETARLALEAEKESLKASAKAKLIAGEPMTEAEAAILLG